MKNNTAQNILEMIQTADVEWKALGDVAIIYGGLTGKSKADFENGNAKYISYKNIFDNIEVDFNKLETVKVSSNEKQHQVKYGDILFTGSSETAEEAGMSSAITTNTKECVYLNSFSFGVRFNSDINIIPEFAKYLFRCDFMRAEIKKSASGVTRFNVSKERFKKIQIPILPLSVQTEIVRVLDAMTARTTELTTELNNELIQRKTQYQYYRDYLFDFDKQMVHNLKIIAENTEVEWKKVEEIFDISAGGDVPKEALSEIKTEEFSIPILSNGIKEKSLYGWTNQAKINKPSLTISARGTIGWTSIQEQPFFPIVRLLVLTPKVKLNLKYAYYFLKTIENNYKVPESGIPQLTKPMIKDIQIPLPSLSEQARIVSILDKFDTLANSISEGLPKEIELRQKQYGYYRDLLLGFSEQASKQASKQASNSLE